MAWQTLLEKAPNAVLDFYFSPDYVWLNRLTDDAGEPRVIYLESGQGLVWYPVLIRPVPSVYNVPAYDATSPYGFGGPLVISENITDRQLLLSELGNWWQRYCSENSIIAEFTRFHPLLENDKDVSWQDAYSVKDVVWFDLTVPEEILYANLHTQKRRSLKKAEKAGLVFSDSWEHESVFRALYKTSMTQKDAGAFYHFSDAFFDALSMLAKQDPGIRLHSVLLDGKVISSGIFLAAGDTVEYFLGANAPEAREYHASAWMLFNTALVSKAAGYTRYILGGGLSADDELFRFKRQFSPLTATYRIGRRVYDEAVYEAIKATYSRKWLGGQSERLADAPLFFYRDIPTEAP